MNYYILAIVMVICFAVIVMYFTLSYTEETRQYVKLATCDQLLELMNNTNYGIEYHNQWIIKECWK